MCKNVPRSGSQTVSMQGTCPTSNPRCGGRSCSGRAVIGRARGCAAPRRPLPNKRSESSPLPRMPRSKASCSRSAANPRHAPRALRDIRPCCAWTAKISSTSSGSRSGCVTTRTRPCGRCSWSRCKMTRASTSDFCPLSETVFARETEQCAIDEGGPREMSSPSDGADDRSFFDSLIVALDFSATADRILPIVGRLAQRGGLGIQLVTTASPGLQDYDLADLAARTEQIHGCPVTSVLIEGHDTAKDLAAFARSNPRALMCIASHGRTAIGELLMGSMTEELLRRHPGPMLAIGPAVEDDYEVAGTLLVAVDDA